MKGIEWRKQMREREKVCERKDGRREEKQIIE